MVVDAGEGRLDLSQLPDAQGRALRVGRGWISSSWACLPVTEGAKLCLFESLIPMLEPPEGMGGRTAHR